MVGAFLGPQAFQNRNIVKAAEQVSDSLNILIHLSELPFLRQVLVPGHAEGDEETTGGSTRHRGRPLGDRLAGGG
jgi:hypothetical protein